MHPLQRKGVSRGQIADAAKTTNLQAGLLYKGAVELHVVNFADRRITEEEDLVFSYLNTSIL